MIKLDEDPINPFITLQLQISQLKGLLKEVDARLQVLEAPTTYRIENYFTK